MKNVEIVILTKSTKNKGYCVAGIDMNTRQWVRLVSDDVDSHGALYNQDMQCSDMTFCEPLDIVRVPVISPSPKEYQPENILIDTTQYWEKIGKLSIYDVLKLHPPENHQPLLGNIYHYITAEKIGTVGYSLVLINVKNLVITHPRPGSTKAKFLYGQMTYENMSVTDPDFYYTPDPTTIDNAILVVSLPDVPYQERKYYKFVAKIFTI